ncbi:MAG: hypothetical protein AAF907_16740 [Planctomycetota bacterium]
MSTKDDPWMGMIGGGLGGGGPAIVVTLLLKNDLISVFNLWVWVVLGVTYLASGIAFPLGGFAGPIADRLPLPRSEPAFRPAAEFVVGLLIGSAFVGTLSLVLYLYLTSR